jgi:hypothetical protein
MTEPKPVQRFYDPGHTETQIPQPVQQEAPPMPRDSRMDDILEGLLRWIAYSVFMLLMLIPFLQGWKLATGCMLLGHVSAQLNKIISHLQKPL